jgi:histidine triad (HIT) family protein
MAPNHSDCLFCRIVAGSIPATRVYEDEDLIAFADIHPQAPTHLLIIPKKHIASLATAASEDAPLLGRLLAAASDLARSKGLADGYRVVVNTGDDGGQTVHHLHLHLLGGRQMTWPPG